MRTWWRIGTPFSHSFASLHGITLASQRVRGPRLIVHRGRPRRPWRVLRRPAAAEHLQVSPNQPKSNGLPRSSPRDTSPRRRRAHGARLRRQIAKVSSVRRDLSSRGGPGSDNVERPTHLLMLLTRFSPERTWDNVARRHPFPSALKGILRQHHQAVARFSLFFARIFTCAAIATLPRQVDEEGCRFRRRSGRRQDTFRSTRKACLAPEDTCRAAGIARSLGRRPVTGPKSRGSSGRSLVPSRDKCSGGESTSVGSC